MPDQGQGLFEIMDSALKRQREGMGGASAPSPEPATPADSPVAPLAGKSSSGSQAIVTIESEEVVVVPTNASRVTQSPVPVPAPSNAVQPLQTAIPAKEDGVFETAVTVRTEPIVPQTPVASSPAQIGGNPSQVHQPAVPPSEARKPITGYTERLSRVPDSVRTIPPAGSLSPGEVLRGTVFASARSSEVSDRQEPLQPIAPVQPAAPQAAPAKQQQFRSGPVAPVSGMQRPVGNVSGVPGINTVRNVSAVPSQVNAVSSVSSSISGGSESVSGISGPISGVQGAAGSGRAVVTPNPSLKGFVVSVEMAITAALVVLLLLLASFTIGYWVKGSAGPGSGSSTNGVEDRIARGLPAGSGDSIKDASPDSIKPLKGVGRHPVTGGPGNTGKTSSPVPKNGDVYAVEIVRQPSKAAANKSLKHYKNRGASGLWVGKVKNLYAVYSGKYRSYEEARQAKSRLVALGIARSTQMSVQKFKSR
jgi:SPOR domain